MKKNKYIIILLAILIVLLFMLFLLNKEGMGVKCKYQYLSPNQQNTPLNDYFINTFIIQFNMNMNLLGSPLQINRFIYDIWIRNKIICTEEVLFYIKMKSFPINEYLVNEVFNNNRIRFPPPFNSTTISFAYSGRGIFLNLVMPAYIGNNAYIQDVVDARLIYDGTKAEPSCEPPPPPPDPDPVPVSAPVPPPLPDLNKGKRTYACTAICNKDCNADYIVPTKDDTKTYACSAACNNACNDNVYFKYES
jgi:hypothetical protein